MKAPILIAVAFTAICCNHDYITVTETRSVHDQNSAAKVEIVKKLRRQDRLPVSILIKSTAPGALFTSMDSLYYDSRGRNTLIKTFELKEGAWLLVRSYKPGLAKAN